MRVQQLSALLGLLGAAAIPGPASADRAGPCTGFLIPPAAELREKPSSAEKVLRKADKWLGALPHPGHVYAVSDKVKVSASDSVEKGAGCYQRDFTVEGEFIRLWIEPWEFRDESAWVKLGELETFTYSHPGKWRTQDVTRTLHGLLVVVNGAIREAQAAREGGQGAKSVRTVLQGKPEVIWRAALEGLMLAGWRIELADRSAGIVTTKARKAPARAFATCVSLDADEEEVAMNLLLVPEGGGVHIRAVLSLGGAVGTAEKCRSRGILEEQAFARIRSALEE